MNIEMIKKIILVILVLILGVGGFFWFKNRQIKGSYKDYVVKEVGGRKVMENKKAGFSVSVPVGWEAKALNVEEGSMAFYYPGTEGEMRNGIISAPIKRGCVIETALLFKKMTFDEIKRELKLIHWGLGIKSEQVEEISIKGMPALKDSFDSTALGSAIAVYILTEKVLYEFSFYPAPEDKLVCIQEFNKFLETISIK
jgi:hypothetical protein